MASWYRLAAATIAPVLVLAASACGGSARSHVIVFSATSPGSPVAQLFSIQPSGGGLTKLTTGAHPAIAPAVSPDGKRIAFSRGEVGIFTMNADGTGLRRLTINGRDSFPTWSPDGKSIAFARPRGSKWRLVVVPSGGGKPKELSQAPPVGRPSWTGAGLLVPSGADLLKVDPASGRVLKYYGANIDAIWGLPTVELSPDVSMLTYVGARYPEPGDMECGEGPCQRYGLYEEHLTGKDRKPHMIAKDAGPGTFSPDGRQLVFVGAGKLLVRQVAGGATKALSTGSVYPTVTTPPAWG